ncbi:MAG: hypothetical protein K2H31_10940, partial [Lachnospiraceae bacterium]|nr:hypothetical protein [Lachnospiraceae bacterium]
YGLGRTAAWNCDVSGEWSGDFAGKEDYVQMWKRIVDYSTGNVSMGDDSVNVVTVGEFTEVVYQTQDYGSETEIYVTLIDPQGDSREEKLHATAPGKYEAELSTPQTGLYHFNIRRTLGGEIQSYMTTAAAVQFADEYKFDVSTASYLRFVEQYGRIITKEDSVWTRLKTEAGERYPLASLLIALSICLFMADVAMRRFQYVPRRPAWLPTIDKIIPDEEPPVEKEKSVKKKPKQTKQSEQALDTSQLLKKKDDRNIR